MKPKGKKIIALLICFTALNVFCSAQQLKPFLLNFSLSNERYVFSNNLSTSIFPLQNFGKDIPCLPQCSLKYTLPKGAVFCQIEDAIYSKLNFWVKFRMGTDDRYSN